MVKAKYNPSTGKASYNAVTGKQQIAVAAPGFPCQYCDPTPSKIKVTLSGINAVANGCKACSVSDVTILENFAFNGTYILSQEPPPFSPCFWRYIEPLDEPYRTRRWNSTDGSCTSLFSSAASNSFQVYATRVGNYLRVKAEFRGDAQGLQFECTAAVDVGTCVDVTSQPNEIISADGCLYDPTPPLKWEVGYGGVMSVEAIT